MRIANKGKTMRYEVVWRESDEDIYGGWNEVAENPAGDYETYAAAKAKADALNGFMWDD